jgi:hypothetical protein
LADSATVMDYHQSLFSRPKHEILLRDGMHLSRKGHAILQGQVASAIRERITTLHRQNCL